MSNEGQAELRWHSPQDQPFGLVGFAWFETDGIYRRLPVKPIRELPPAVDGLANSTAGGQIRFQTNSKRLSVRVRLAGLASMNHMPATGQCGFDCYIGPPKNLRYCSTTKYDHRQAEYECVLFTLPQAELRNIVLNFPLYQGVKEVEVGLGPEAEVLPPPPFEDDRRVVVYGTSITQGGCACRPGMAYTNILSRRLNLEFINLGFSGSGRGEAEVAEVIAGTPGVGCFVLDYESNCGGTEPLAESFPRFVEILRSSHPGIPILAASRIAYSSDLFNAEAVKGREERKAIQRQVVEERRADGDDQIHFYDGTDSLGEDFDECTVDGVHPNDLGFLRMANAMEPVLADILGV